MGQSSDDRVLNEQERQWEDAGARYVAHLATVRPQFPPGLRLIDESYFLHDATVQGLGRRGQNLVMILQLDTPPQSILTLTYELVEDPVVLREALPPESCGTGARVDWLYNEIEMVFGDPPTWRETLLLSNGWELSLHFRDVRVEEAQAVLPAPRIGVAPAGVSFILHQAAQK
jgi:hypothetical protein